MHTEFPATDMDCRDGNGELLKVIHENRGKVKLYYFIPLFFHKFSAPSLFYNELWEYQYINKYKWHVGTGWNSAKHLTGGEVAKNEEQKYFRFTSSNVNSIYLSFHIKIN